MKSACKEYYQSLRDSCNPLASDRGSSYAHIEQVKVYLVRFFEKEKSHVSDRPASSGREGHALDTRQARNFSVPISPLKKLNKIRQNLRSFHWRNFESWQASVKNTATQSQTTVVLLRRDAVETTRLNVIYHRKK